MLSTIFFFLFITFQYAYCQIEQWRYVLIERMDAENDQQDINNVIERLSEVINNPILINITNKEELEQIPFLSDRQIENLLYYLYVYGEMKSIHELRMVEDFDLATIELVSPFFKVEPRQKEDKRSVENLLKGARHQLIIRYDRSLNEKEGYVDKSDSVLLSNPNKQYLGSPFYSSVRYRMEYPEQFKIGLVMEKDAGEKGIGYWSGFLQLKNRGMLKNLIIGNYKVRMGAGLVINNGFSMGKNMMGSNLISRNQGITPHASVDEYNYLQGIAAEIKLSRWLLTMFWSYRSLDARIENDTISSIKKDGLHNLYREKQKINQANMISAGMHIGYKGSFYQIGFSAFYHVFNKTYFPDLRLYNLHYWRGRRNGNAAVDYQIRKYGLLFSGEVAISQNGKPACVNALSYTPAPDLTLTFIQRFYHKEYHSWFGKSYSEGSELNNESGIAIYAGYKPFSFLEFSGGIDMFRFDWPRFGIDAPSAGYDVSCQISYQQCEKLRLNLRYKLKQKDKNRSDAPDSLAHIQRYQRHQLAFSLHSTLSESFFFRTGIESVLYHFERESPSKGWLISQSAGYRRAGFPLQADLSCAFFDTDNTATKVYLSEKNVLYGFGIPSFYGNGMRVACHFRYDPRKWLTFWLKIAHTSYFDRKEIGTALELIQGNTKTDLWTQVQLKF
ncbi:MAG: hypothetical protein RR346_08200 [Bacteroidales bacterium]